MQCRGQETETANPIYPGAAGAVRAVRDCPGHTGDHPRWTGLASNTQPVLLRCRRGGQRTGSRLQRLVQRGHECRRDNRRRPHRQSIFLNRRLHPATQALPRLADLGQMTGLALIQRRLPISGMPLGFASVIKNTRPAVHSRGCKFRGWPLPRRQSRVGCLFDRLHCASPTRCAVRSVAEPGTSPGATS